MATYTEAYQRALANNPQSKVILHTLSIEHPDITNIYLVHQKDGITATLENGNSQVFMPMPFEITLPSSEGYSRPTASIRISNVDQSVTDQIETITDSETSSKIYYRPYLSDALTSPVTMTPPFLEPFNVEINARVLTAQLDYFDLSNLSIGRLRYTTNGFPLITR